VAAGFEWRRERLAGAREDTYTGYQGFAAGDSNEAGSRAVTAVFAEAIVPLVRDVEMQLALRRESYSDFGNSTAPKVAVAWKPSRQLLLRGGYSEGFRAPSLYQLHLDRRTASVPVVDAPRCDAYTAAFGKDDLRTRSVCGFQGINALTTGNPALRAAESTASVLGIVIEPWSRLSIAIDAFDIRERGRVVVPLANTVIAYEDSFPGFRVVRSAPQANDVAAGTRGPIVSTGTGVAASYLNAGTQEANGIDLELRGHAAFGPGVLRFESLNTRLHTLRSASAREEPFDLHNLPFAPRYRGWHRVSWTQGSWHSSAVASVIGSSVDPRKGGIVESWTTVDLQAGFAAMKNLVFIAGVRNVADRMPPFVDDVLGFDEFTHSIVGRSFYLRAAYRF
jgi:iron complex outermembrane receptor protein